MNKDIKAINDEFTLQEELSVGKICKRQDNGDFWYINPEETIARFITKEQLKLFHMWDKKDLLATEKQFETLAAIGGLPSPEYSMYPDYLQFPATIITKGGQHIDLCLFHFSKSPPFQRYFKKTLLLDDIAEIKPSELALSHSLRLSSLQADEIKMSFCPFMVQTNTGKLITFNGVTQFASTGEIKGSDVISEVNFSYDKFDKLEGVSFDDITYIIGKLDNRLELLFKQYREGFEEKNIFDSIEQKSLFRNFVEKFSNLFKFGHSNRTF